MYSRTVDVSFRLPRASMFGKKRDIYHIIIKTCRTISIVTLYDNKHIGLSVVWSPPGFYEWVKKLLSPAIAFFFHPSNAPEQRTASRENHLCWQKTTESKLPHWLSPAPRSRTSSVPTLLYLHRHLDRLDWHKRTKMLTPCFNKWGMTRA